MVTNLSLENSDSFFMEVLKVLRNEGNATTTLV